VVVTGAGGALGAGIAQALMDDGYHVAALDRDADALKLAAESWDNDADDAFHTIVVDQTSRADVDDAFAALAADGWSIAGVVANAGYARFGGFLDMPTQVWQRHVDINLTGTFHICQAAAQRMAAARTGGWLTVVSSNLALGHADQVGAYCTTKAALLTMVRSAAAELGVHRIRVNAVLPGVVDTAMTHGMLEEPGVREGLLAKTPLGRLGTVEDITGVVRFLASPAAGWITGANILADGGQSIYGQPTWISQDRRAAHEPSWVGGYPTPTTEWLDDFTVLTDNH
jgi:NAD(P)-dependent dehydrogenase (short-subunit alcohol dehydrogenase family)